MEFNVLYNEDCMEIFNRLPSESIDLIVTDPPYKNISGGKPHTKEQPSGILSKNDGKIFDYNDIEPEIWFPQVYRVLKQESHCYIMTNLINLAEYLHLAEKVGFQLHNLLVWQKSNCTPNRWYMKNCEYVLFLRKGRAKRINNVGSKTVHSFKNIIGNKTHPTEKPVELMKFYIENSSNGGDIVFDPFAGTGSCLLAAKELGRKYIGCEVDKKYYDIAIKRLNEVVN